MPHTYRITAELTIDDVDIATALRPAGAGATQPREVNTPIAFLTLSIPVTEIENIASDVLGGKQPDIEIEDIIFTNNTYHFHLTTA